MRFCRYATDPATRKVRFFWREIFWRVPHTPRLRAGLFIFPCVRLPRYSAYVPLYILWKNDNSLSSRAQRGICFSPKPNDRLRPSKQVTKSAIFRTGGMNLRGERLEPAARR